MAYLIRVMPRAARDLLSIYNQIDGAGSEAARKWYRGLREAIRSLGAMPHRCPEAPEDRSLRHLLYGDRPHVYRVIYRTIEEKKLVEVLHIRHGAMDRFEQVF